MANDLWAIKTSNKIYISRWGSTPRRDQPSFQQPRSPFKLTEIILPPTPPQDRLRLQVRVHARHVGGVLV